MKRFPRSALALLASLVVVAACRQASGPDAARTPSPDAPAPKGQFLLSAEPAGVKGVGELQKAAKEGESVAAVGRIGGSEKPFVDGAAAFTIVDMELVPCQDGCPTPWDYCCDLDKLPTRKALVKVVDGDGRPVMSDARALLGIKESATVVVRAKAKRDEAGNLSLLADGLYVRP